jgi:hypothetical protein
MLVSADATITAASQSPALPGRVTRSMGYTDHTAVRHIGVGTLMKAGAILDGRWAESPKTPAKPIEIIYRSFPCVAGEQHGCGKLAWLQDSCGKAGILTSSPYLLDLLTV